MPKKKTATSPGVNGEKKKKKYVDTKPESAVTLLSTESKAKKKKTRSNGLTTPSPDKAKKKKTRSLFSRWGSKKVIVEEGDSQPKPQTSDNEIGDGPHDQDRQNEHGLASSLEDDRVDLSMNDDDLGDQMKNSQRIDTGPPIGVIVADSMDDDNVSDIGEVITDADPAQEIIDGVEIIYNPDDTDICFDDLGHPGTKDWIVVIRECLERFEGVEYSPPVYKAIKKKLRGRRFLVRTRRSARTSWREATKPEVIELFGERFNEERRRVAEGITDDLSEVDSSLQNSAAQSEDSFSEGDLGEKPIPTEQRESTPKSNTVPTPRVSNQLSPGIDFEFESDPVILESPPSRIPTERTNGHGRPRKYPEPMEKSTQHLQDAIKVVEEAEDYARPFLNQSLIQDGMLVDEKLTALLALADSKQSIALQSELNKLQEISRQMRLASMAPLLDILIRIEGHVDEYFRCLSEENAETNIPQTVSATTPLNGTATNGVDARSPVRSANESDSELDDTDRENTERTNSNSYRARHDRTIPVNSEHKDDELLEEPIQEVPNEDSTSAESPLPVINPIEQSPISMEGDGDESLGHADPMTPGSEIDNQDFETPLNDDPSDDTESISARESELEENDIDEGSDASEQIDSVDLQEDLLKVKETGDSSASPAVQSGRQSLSYEQSLRQEDFGGSFREVALGGSSRASMMLTDHTTTQDYEESYRAEDLGGSYREEELGGSYENSGLSSSLGTGFGESSTMDQVLLATEEENEEEDIVEFIEGPLDTENGGGGIEREEIGIEGTLELRGEGGALNLDASQSSVGAAGHVLELGPSPDGDELSSVGRSMPGLYGSDSESEGLDDEDYEEIEIDEDDYSDEDESEPTDESSASDTLEEEEPKQDKKDAPNPKLEQFFDRLQHFFEVRRKVEERAEIMDPSEKFRNLKVKLHSGGIKKKSGKFKKDYQQRSVRDKVVRNLDELYDVAEQASEEFKRTLYQMAAEVKGMSTNSIEIAALKPRDRAFEKAQEEYTDRVPGPPESWLFDIVRGSVVCKSYKQMNDVNKWLGNNCQIVLSKNRFREPAFNGYRDLLFHISVTFGDNLFHVCEIQVHQKDIKALDDQFGMPKHYEYFRSSFAGPWRTQEQVLDDLAMLNKYGEIEGQCMVKLMKSRDPDQLRLFANLCRDKLDEFDRALELYRRVLILQEEDKADDHEDAADTYLNIGLVLGALGDHEESLLNLEKALKIQEAVLGSDHIDVAQTFSEIGHMLCLKGDYAGALVQYQEALLIREAKLGREHFLVIGSLQDIGRALQEKGDFLAAESELRRALNIQEAVLGDVHPDVATTHAMIGTTLCKMGDFGKAMEEHRLALSIRETTMGKNHSATAESHTDIGIVLCQKGDYEVSEWRHRKALRIREAVKGKDDEDCAASSSHLGEVLRRKGDYDAAIKEIKRATRIREHNLGMDHPVTAGSYIDLGQVYLRKRKFDQALHEFRRAKVVRESILGSQHPDTALAYNAVGNGLSQVGEHEAALTHHRKAIATYEAVFGMNHPSTATGYQHLADALFAKGDKDEALIEHRKALAVRARILSKDHPDTAVSCSRIGKLLSEKGDLVGALVAYRQALAITIGLCGEEHPDSATAHINVGTVLAAQGDQEESTEEIQQALHIREATLGNDHPDTARVYSLLGTLYNRSGNFELAEEYHKKALSILEKKLGKKNKDTKIARQRLLKAVEKEDESVGLLG
eukprot:Nitzschia sp. Nitz4//scaffold12_size214221//99109//104274//NITZ4_001502-RA/size214221-processed-gene-0.158-mRNA-1//-1//CDS//3329535026//3105//frame0